MPDAKIKWNTTMQVMGGTSFHALVGGGWQGEYIYRANFVIGAVSLCHVACEGMAVVGLGLQFPYSEGSKDNHYLNCIFTSHCLKALRLLYA